MSDISWSIPEEPKDFVVKVSICNTEEALKFSTSNSSGSISLKEQINLRCTSGLDRQIEPHKLNVKNIGAEYRFPVNDDLHIWFISEYGERITYGEGQVKLSLYPAIFVFIGSDDPRDARGQLVLNFAKNKSTFQIVDRVQGVKELIIRTEAKFPTLPPNQTDLCT